MTTFRLKMLATVFMFIDHIGLYFEELPFSFVLRVVGRMSYPLFLFCMIWGYHYTKSRKIFLLRLYMMSVFMGLMMYLLEFHYFPNAVIEYGFHNIFASMFLVGLLISIIENYPKNKKKSLIFLGLLFFLQIACIMIPKFVPILNHLSGDYISSIFPFLLRTEYGLEFVVLGVLMYFLKDKRELFSVVYIVFCVVQFAQDMEYGMPMQAYMILALPLMLRYNNEKGYGMKYFFYIFYPAHTFALFYLANYLRAQI